VTRRDERAYRQEEECSEPMILPAGEWRPHGDLLIRST
jgi:hypothetical protein